MVIIMIFQFAFLEGAFCNSIGSIQPTYTFTKTDLITFPILYLAVALPAFIAGLCISKN